MLLNKTVFFLGYGFRWANFNTKINFPFGFPVWMPLVSELLWLLSFLRSNFCPTDCVYVMIQIRNEHQSGCCSWWCLPCEKITWFSFHEQQVDWNGNMILFDHAQTQKHPFSNEMHRNNVFNEIECKLLRKKAQHDLSLKSFG